MNAQDFFRELTNFAPQHTSIIFPMFLGFCVFVGICTSGYNKTFGFQEQEYSTVKLQDEKDKFIKYVLLVGFAVFASYFTVDITYTIIDWKKNKKWYVWKYKWFPNMLS